MNPARFYSYILFRVPQELIAERKENPNVTSFFDKLKKEYNLQSADIFDLGDPDLTMFRLAENDNIAVCVFRFHDLDIVETEWSQSSEDVSVSEFWKNRLDDLKKHFTDIPSCFGISSALFTHSENLLTENISEYTEIPLLGKFYHIKPNHYILVAQDETTEPADFLGRDFPVIFSFLRKIEFEHEELRKIRASVDESKNRINDFFLIENPNNIENFLIMKKDESYLQRNISLLAKLQQTLKINILNLEKYCNKYQIENDKIFAPFLKNANHICNQIDYDLNYARLTLEAFDSHVQVLDLIIKNRNEKHQKHIERLIALLIIPIGIGQIGAALGWEWKEVLFFIFFSMAVIYFSLLLTERKSIIFKFLNRIRQESRRLSSYFLTLISYKKKNL